MTGPMRCRATSQRRLLKLPHAAGALQDVSEVLRAADRHHASEFGEFERADAGGQGRERAQWGSWSRAQSQDNRQGCHFAEYAKRAMR
jgi:hypothetical protein